MRIVIPITVILCLSFVACDDNKEINHEFIIKTGRECGWCGGSDSLTITKVKSHFYYDNPCDNTKDKELERETVSKEWHDLLITLNWNEFTDININTCALCADGCDTWIWIQHNDSIHQIRFTDGSPEIVPILPFVEKLQALQAEFR